MSKMELVEMTEISCFSLSVEGECSEFMATTWMLYRNPRSELRFPPPNGGAELWDDGAESSLTPSALRVLCAASSRYHGNVLRGAEGAAGLMCCSGLLGFLSL